jgi:hypothetical protein
MPTRRTFIKQTLSGSAILMANGSLPPRRVLGANDRVRIGLIGAGARGQEIFKSALRCPNVEGAAVADVYTRRLDEVKQFVPTIQTYRDFRRLLEDKTIDAVLIATPQHLHALNFVPAIQAGKDVYQEKTMAFNPDRRAHEEGCGGYQAGCADWDPVDKWPSGRGGAPVYEPDANGSHQPNSHPPLPE